MIQSLRIKNVALDETHFTSVELPDNASIKDMILSAGLNTGDLSHYYTFSGALFFNDPYLPYIFSKNQVLYDVPFEEAKVTDFLETFNLFGKEVDLVTGYAQAGGPGLCEIEEMWNSALPILNGIAIVCSISGFNLGTLIRCVKWFCSLFKRRKRTPHVCYDVVYSKPAWNHHELASILEIDAERSKVLLKLFGYKYDRRKMLYVEGDQIDEIKKELRNTKGLAI